MNILGSAIKYFVDAWEFATGGRAAKATAGGEHRMVATMLTGAARGMAVGGNGNLDHFMRLAITNPWFYSASRVIADRISDTAAFRVEGKHRGKWVTLDDHHLLTVLSRPNALMTGGLLLGSTAEWMNTAGNGYWFPVTDRPGRGPIQEIWMLPADKVEPDPATLRRSPVTGQPVIDYRYTLSTMRYLPGENVLHFRTPNLFDFWRGGAPLSALQTILPTDLSQSNWLGSFFGEDNAVPTAVISLPPELDDPGFDAVKRDIKEQFGAQRATAITRGGDMNVEVIQHSIDEMRVIEGMQFNASAIRSVLRVPKRDELPSGESLLAAEIALMRDAVQPMLNLFASWMTLKLAPFYEREPGTLRIVAENVVPQDAAMAVTEYQAYSEDRTLNENREKQKLPPLKLTGELSPLQDLFDQVPQRYVDLLAPIILDRLGNKTADAQPHPHAHLLALMTGQSTPTHALSGPNRQQLLTQMTGRRRSSRRATPGRRVSGMPTPDQMVRRMIGSGPQGGA